MNTPTGTGFFQLNIKDISKGLILAALTGFLLPISAIIQTSGFSLATANWSQILLLALNGAVVGFVGYIIKALGSDESGKVFGRIG